MKADNRFAVFCMVALALLVLGLTVENYWNCRLLEGRSMTQCEPHFVGKWGAGYLPVEILPQNGATH